MARLIHVSLSREVTIIIPLRALRLVGGFLFKRVSVKWQQCPASDWTVIVIAGSHFFDNFVLCQATGKIEKNDVFASFGGLSLICATILFDILSGVTQECQNLKPLLSFSNLLVGGFFLSPGCERSFNIKNFHHLVATMINRLDFDASVACFLPANSQFIDLTPVMRYFALSTIAATLPFHLF